MTLSWSHKLFLRLNALHGKVQWFDWLMIAVAHGLVYPVIVIFFFWARSFWPVIIFAYLIGYALTYAIAFAYRHPRPIREFPNIHLLIRTLGTWKSFPSDHAMTSMIPAMLAALMGAPAALLVFLFFCSFAIGFSRVYVGVHYPRDIIGGFTVGALSAIVAYLVVA